MATHNRHIISRIIKIWWLWRLLLAEEERANWVSFGQNSLKRLILAVSVKSLFTLCATVKTRRSLGVQFWLLAYNRTKTHTRVHAHARTYHCIHTYTSSVYTHGECHCLSLHTHIHFVSIDARWIPLFTVCSGSNSDLFCSFWPASENSEPRRFTLSVAALLPCTCSSLS